jgi:hypothetical protein
MPVNLDIQTIKIIIVNRNKMFGEDIKKLAQYG